MTDAREELKAWIESQKRELDALNRKLEPMIGCGPTSTTPVIPPSEHNDAPDFVLQNYDLAFEDTFDGPELIDPSKWGTALLWGPDLTINNEEQYYVDTLRGDTSAPNPFSKSADGNLLITAAPITGTKPVTTNGRAGGQPYSSGILTTRDAICFTYGYTEVCLKAPCGVNGQWCAAWLLNCFYYQNAAAKAAAEGIVDHSDKFNPEIDFWEGVEGDNNTINEVTNAYHFYTGDRASPDNYYLWSVDEGNFRQYNVNTNTVDTQFNIYDDCNGANQFRLNKVVDETFCDEFHTVGCHWQPGRLEFYYDGRVVNCIEDAPFDLVPDQSMYLIINFAVGGNYPFRDAANRSANMADYPASLEVASARIYTPR